MPIDVLMPALSPTMTEGNLAKWLKKTGEAVKPGDVIAEIETDKATMEVESTDTGILGKILVEEGSSGVKINTPIAILLKKGEDMSVLENYTPKGDLVVNKVEKNIQETKPAEVKAQESSKCQTDRIFVSPLAKRIAENNNISLAGIEGSGPHGRIVKNDVETVASCKSAVNSLPSMRNINEFSVKPHTTMRKVIADRLLESKTTIPHFYLSVDVNLTELLVFREKINAGASIVNEKPSYRISVNDFVIKACAMALKEHGDVNASWSDKGMIYYNNVDVSVAVSIEGGLITPIVKNADHKSITQISSEMKDLAKRARENKLRPDEFQGGSFSISNLGMYNIKQFNAIINPPQSAILAVGCVTRVPLVVKDKVEIHDLVNITISCDHRVVDGALGAVFINKIRHYLENPYLMLV